MRSVETVRAELNERFGDIFGFAVRVVEENQVHADFWRGKEIETGVVLYHFAKAVNLLDATCRLCHDGFAREAIASSRSLFNLFINLRWLTKPGLSSKRLERFSDHEMTSKANNAVTLIKWDKNITEEQKQQHRALIRKFGPIAKSLGINKGRNGMYPNWHPGIQEMAKDVDLLDEYYLTYRRLSQTGHTDPESVGEYLKRNCDNTRVRGDVGPSTKYVLVVMMDTIRYFLNVKRDAALFLEFEEGKDEVAELRRLMKKYADSFAGC